MTSCHGRTNGAPGHRSAFEVGLAGNPNTGKSSILNALTGSRHHVGNWPGKTVARLEGTFSASGIDVLVVDLPGIYSFAASSPEQVIARDYLSAGGRDAVITVVDAANLERNLYMAVQILEMDVPAVVALNMVDVAQRRGLSVNATRLSARLGVPVVPTVARTGRGIDTLRTALVDLARCDCAA